MIISVQRFVDECLPKILGGKSSLRCYFTTYRKVRNFPAGDVEVNKPGLSVRVSEGGNFSVSSFIPLLMDDTVPKPQVAREQLAMSIANSGIPTDDDGQFLLVAYAGFRAFDESIRFLCEVRERCPLATIVVVTCDCLLEEKAICLDPYIKSGTISYVTEGPGCGGRVEMAAMLKGVIERWKPAETT